MKCLYYQLVLKFMSWFPKNKWFHRIIEEGFAPWNFSFDFQIHSTFFFFFMHLVFGNSFHEHHRELLPSVCSRWKLPLFPSAKAPETQATLMTTRKRKSESPSQRSVQRSLQSSKFEPRVAHRGSDRDLDTIGDLTSWSTRVDLKRALLWWGKQCKIPPTPKWKGRQSDKRSTAPAVLPSMIVSQRFPVLFFL